MFAFDGSTNCRLVNVLLISTTCVFTNLDLVSADATLFLGNSGQHRSVDGLHDGHEPSDMLLALERIGGREHRWAAERRVVRLEEAMRQTFLAMPKDGTGRLDSAGVRYLLHRHFVQHHGWFVKGLDNAGDSWKSGSPAAVFKSHAREHHDLFEGRLRSHGFDLHQAAVFAGAFEEFVHKENVLRLDAAYRVLDLSKFDENLCEQDAVDVIRAYMLLFVQPCNLSDVTHSQYLWMSEQAESSYPTWPETEQFALKVRRAVLKQLPDTEHRSWSTAVKVVEEIGETYGRWQNKECQDLKEALMQMEERNDGRVRLDTFYANPFNSNWQFTESVPYLRQLGSLDESDPQHIKLIIPNYVNSPANCVASSNFFDVCCINECEELLAALEHGLAAPDALPGQIVDLVAALPSLTVSAPRSLPPRLTSRLDDIAARHDGRVPLHGRLFAQWMHHVFPRECPFPSVSGTTKPLTMEAWMEHTNESSVAGEADMTRILDEGRAADRASRRAADAALPWSDEEELFMCTSGLPASEPKSAGALGRCSLMLVAVLVSAALVTSRSSKRHAKVVQSTRRVVYSL